jgi:hypothetical protein
MKLWTKKRRSRKRRKNERGKKKHRKKEMRTHTSPVLVDTTSRDQSCGGFSESSSSADRSSSASGN